jgi:hypothetical protein
MDAKQLSQDHHSADCFSGRKQWASRFSIWDISAKRWNSNATTLLMPLTSGEPGSSAGQYRIVYHLRSLRAGSNSEPIGQALGYAPGAFLKMPTTYHEMPRTKLAMPRALRIIQKSARLLCDTVEKRLLCTVRLQDVRKVYPPPATAIPSLRILKDRS